MSHLPLSIRVPIELDNVSIVRDEAKCIKCGKCRDVCKLDINVLGRYNFDMTGGKAICVNCGQCANVCPVDSISERCEYELVAEAIKDPDKIVIVSTSPSVRVGLGEEFGMADGSFVEGKMVALLRALGVDYVLDTNFAADLTIVEEASELIDRITNNKVLPQFTSCCPAWIKYVETFYPEMIPNISSAKSPIGMQGPTIKTYFAKKKNIDPRKIVNVALTPCTAKKFEIGREDQSAAGVPDLDISITTRELVKMINRAGIRFRDLPDEVADSPLGNGTGAAVIFGATGGVMEAALRTAVWKLTGEDDNAPIDFKEVRGTEGIK